jgi:hypothetical protein
MGSYSKLWFTFFTQPNHFLTWPSKKASAAHEQEAELP